MNKKNVICTLIFLFFCSLVHAQTVKSERTYLRLNNKPKKVVVEVADTIPPTIRIISPAIKEGEKHKSIVPEMNIIGKASDINGVSSVIVNSEIMKVSEEGLFTYRLFLNRGENEISIVTMDKNENYLENKYIVDYVPPELTFVEKVNNQSKYYALIIGINNYDDPVIPNLDNPIQDAQRLYEILTTEYTFDKENITFIKNAKREDIINILDDLAKNVTTEDNLLIFFAGHGWWDPDANIGYWLPSDARQDSKAAWFGNSRLVDYLKSVESKHTLLIADACFTGSIFKTRTPFPDKQKAFQKLYELPSRNAMTSGTLTEVPDRSSFMKFLSERLSDNKEECLASEQLFSSIYMAVINNSDAVPQFGDIRNVGDQGGDFIFIRRK